MTGDQGWLVYAQGRNERVAFPLGGIGAGMFCLEGTGALTNFSLRHRPKLFDEPLVFSAVNVRSRDGQIARVLEGSVPAMKVFSPKIDGAESALGLSGKHYGLPRFSDSEFRGRFPFGIVRLSDAKVPVGVEITGWSPFVPLHADDSSLPVAALEYRFENRSAEPVELVYSFHAANFMAAKGTDNQRIVRAENGFVLEQMPIEGQPWQAGAFCASVDDPQTRVDCAWFRGGWFDPLTMLWQTIASGEMPDKPPHAEGAPGRGGSLFVPLTLQPGEKRTVRLLLSWYVPESDLKAGGEETGETTGYYKPWYAGVFANINEVSADWAQRYESLRKASETFSDCLHGSTMPSALLEAVSANLSILKSPTVLRQADGRLWGWEGSNDRNGACYGSCTHVWNYAQTIPHLFPELERGVRTTEFVEGQDERGHQNFRIPLPIRPSAHLFHAASDGQLGGMMKAYREWMISGDLQWIKRLWPRIKQSLSYCIDTWDPDLAGVLVEPHHNTYDIEFWGPNGMCSSIYLGALKAASAIARAVGDDTEIARWDSLYVKGRAYVETELFNGEYFEQKIMWDGLRAPSPASIRSVHTDYSPEALELLVQEGPKYQYGNGCLSDGIIGAWLAQVCGLGDILDRAKVRSHLLSVYKYNLKRDLSEHVNPQRPGYALGQEGGLLLCTWPKHGSPSLPFVYSNEVWSGIEYQVASHLFMLGCTAEATEIVRLCRARYDGRVRNPFNEYECGHWYARAMSSWSLLQGWSGVQYDARDRTLRLSPNVPGDFRVFLCTKSGYGYAGIREGKPFVEAVAGEIPVERFEL